MVNFWELNHWTALSQLIAQTRVYYQWARFEQLDEWWHYLAVVAVLVAIIGHVLWWYRRDTLEQARPVRWTLMMLRLGAFAGLVLFFMQLDKRSELRVTRNSRVAILVDTSLSMSLPGTPSASGTPNPLSRAEEAAQLISSSPVLNELSTKHDVTVYRFDQVPRPVQVAALNKLSRGASTLDTNQDASLPMLTQAHSLTLVACGLVAVGLLLVLISLVAQAAGARHWSGGAWSLFWGSVVSLAGMVVLALGILPASDYPLAALFVAPQTALEQYPRLSDDTFAPTLTAAGDSDGHGTTDRSGSDTLGGTRLPTDWSSALAPTGIETRLGDALKSVLEREQGSPLAGIVVVTDGRSNAGLDPKAITLAAQNQRVPVHFVGVGSEKNPPNVRLVEIDVPKRVYPGDKFSMKALLQCSGLAGQAVTVQVTSGAKGGDPATFAIDAETQLQAVTEDELLTASFELEPKAVGNWTYLVKVLPVAGDMDARDDTQSADVTVIERKNRVLIFAGGPMREYQFVRNLLFRDRDVQSHVLLQSGGDPLSQEAAKLLDEFPADRNALKEYDAILAFDADWTKVSDAQTQALEQWVAEQAGGLMIIAGDVEMPKWIAAGSGGDRSRILRELSPVVLVQSASRLLSTGRVQGEKAYPLKLTDDGKQTEFMWLSDDPVTSAKLWSDFAGVYSFNGAFETKPAAKTLASFGDPSAADSSGNLPIYLASQFYGAGRVVYQGGGEMWRIRQLGEVYFDRYYTKLVRWLSSGRLLLDSDRGILLVDREIAIQGDQVSVRAVLKDQRFQPLVQSEVAARLVDPKKVGRALILRPLPGGTQPGIYTGQFPVQMAGEYLIQLQLGGLGSDEILQASVKARVPAMEMQGAERYDELMLPLATQTGGRYFKGVASAVEPAEQGQETALSTAITPQDQISFVPGVPNRRFQLRWLGWLMGLVAGCLTIEWFARRLHRLA